MGEDSAIVPKLCGIFIFSFFSVVLGLLPMIIHAYFKQKLDAQLGRSRLLSYMTAFGGGVLLCTTFLHLLPEIRESTESLRNKNVITFKETLHLPELLMCLGFLLLYFIEEVSHKLLENKNKTHTHKLGLETYVSNECVPASSTIMNRCNMNEQVQECEGNRPCEACDTQTMGPFLNDANGLNKQNHPLHSEHGSSIFFSHSAGKNFLLVFALSIHEAFEGLAIGLERQPEAVWYLVLAVGSHKAIIALCIGIQMLSSKLERKVAIIYILIFATATSVGVAMGLFLYMENGVVSVVLQGLASGTLVHVVFFELLKPHSNGTPFLGVFMGFACMGTLKYFSE